MTTNKLGPVTYKVHGIDYVFEMKANEDGKDVLFATYTYLGTTYTMWTADVLCLPSCEREAWVWLGWCSWSDDSSALVDTLELKCKLDDLYLIESSKWALDNDYTTFSKLLERLNCSPNRSPGFLGGSWVIEYYFKWYPNQILLMVAAAKDIDKLRVAPVTFIESFKSDDELLQRFSAETWDLLLKEVNYR